MQIADKVRKKNESLHFVIFPAPSGLKFPYQDEIDAVSFLYDKAQLLRLHNYFID
jgi:hypothetical protein